jgi:hypothetical protein
MLQVLVTTPLTWILCTITWLWIRPWSLRQVASHTWTVKVLAAIRLQKLLTQLQQIWQGLDLTQILISYADYMTVEWHQIEKGHRHQRPQIEKVNGATRKLCENLGSTPEIVSRLDKPLTDLLLKFKNASWHGFASGGKLQLCETQGKVDASVICKLLPQVLCWRIW